MFKCYACGSKFEEWDKLMLHYANLHPRYTIKRKSPLNYVPKHLLPEIRIAKPTHLNTGGKIHCHKSGKVGIKK